MTATSVRDEWHHSGPARSPAVITRTLRDQISAELRHRILSGALASGTRVDLDEFAAEFGSSRTPVREALIQLSHDGLVEILPRRGARIRGTTRDEIRDNFSVFGALSGIAAEGAAGKNTPELVVALQRINEELERAVADDPAGVVHANWAFHRTIHRASGSPRLLDLLRTLARTIPLGYFEIVPEQGDISLAEHAQLIDAIVQGDGAAARRIADEHVRVAGDRLIAEMERRGIWTD